MSDARSHRRLAGAPMLVSYTIGDEFAAAHTETYDIGLGGLAMLTDTQLSEGQPLRLVLELRGEPQAPLHLAGSVRWSHHDPGLGRYRTGVAFGEHTPETEEQLRRYIETMYRLRDLGVI